MKPRRWIALVVALIAACADQASKWFVLNRMQVPDHEQVPVLPFFSIVQWWNRGVSFGMGNGTDTSGLQRNLLVLLTLTILAVLGVSLRKARKTWVIAALGLVIGGAIGNLIDRLHYGAVADFLYFHYQQYDFPAFNVGDSCVCIGVGLLLLDGLGLKSKRSVSFKDV